IPNVVRTDQAEGQLFTCISLGSLVAGVANVSQAVQVGLGGGGLPQVWGAAQYFQGYFQVIGLTVAASRFLTAIASKRAPAALFWCVACFVNTGALVLTQTRGAWLACIASMLVVGILWRPSTLVFGLGALSIAALALSGVDWASPVRERVQSIFTLEAGLSGFASSLG